MEEDQGESMDVNKDIVQHLHVELVALVSEIHNKKELRHLDSLTRYFVEFVVQVSPAVTLKSKTIASKAHPDLSFRNYYQN